MTFIDSADIYGGGDNERLIARMLADRRGAVGRGPVVGVGLPPHHAPVRRLGA